MKKNLFTICLLGLLSTISLNAGTYNLTCTNEYSGAKETVKVTASSRSDALEKVKTDPAYAEYSNCS